MLYVFIHPVVLAAILSLKLFHMSAENYAVMLTGFKDCGNAIESTALHHFT